MDGGDCYPVTVEKSINNGQGTNLLKHLQVNLLSHCIFCLRKTKLQRNASSVNNRPDFSEHLQVVPRGELSKCSSTLLSTFNYIWLHFCGNNSDNDGKSKDLFKMLMTSQGDITFLELPRICDWCAEALTTIDKLLQDLQTQLTVLGEIIHDSKYGGKYSWRADVFHTALSCSNLEEETITATTSILGLSSESDSGKDGDPLTVENSPLVESTSPGATAPKQTDESSTVLTKKVPTSSKISTKIYSGNEIIKVDSDVQLNPPEDIDDATDFIDENDEYNDSDPDYIKSESEDDTDWSSSDDTEPGSLSRGESTIKGQEKNQLSGKTKVEVGSSSKPGAKLNSDTSSKNGDKNVTRMIEKMKGKGPYFSLGNPGTGEVQYICNINSCGTISKSLGALRKHQKETHQPATYQCDECGEGYNQLENLKRHKRRVHGLVIRQKCDLCKIQLPTASDMHEHLRAHVGETYLLKCPNSKCHYVFSNAASLSKHLRGAGSNSEKCRKSLSGSVDDFIATTNICQECGYQAVNSIALRGHLIRLHETPTKNFSCPIEGCPQQFTVKQSVACHIPRHDIPSQSEVQYCGVCSLNVKIGKMEEHLKDSHGTGDVIKCNRCPFLYPTREMLVDHLFVHRYGVLSCDICGDDVRFTQHARLCEHYSVMHNIGKSFPCEKCSHISWSQVGAVQHSKLHDDKLSREIPLSQQKTVHKCDLCNAEFWHEKSLRSHKIRLHGAEPFSCNLCEKTFTSQHSLHRHEREHKTGAKEEFKCDVEGCEKIFKVNAKLRNHISSAHLGERPFVCELCGKSYSHDSGLTFHKNSVHLGARAHICDICGESFTAASTLKRHNMIHTGERPFACEICNQKFRFKEVLRRHLEGHERKGADFKPNGPMKQVRKRVAPKKPAS